VFVKVVPLVAALSTRATTVISFVSLTANLAMVHEAVVALTLPQVRPKETGVTLISDKTAPLAAGIKSVTVTPVATDAPLFPTVTV
jgi:hypothetical protein